MSLKDIILATVAGTILGVALFADTLMNTGAI